VGKSAQLKCSERTVDERSKTVRKCVAVQMRAYMRNARSAGAVRGSMRVRCAFKMIRREDHATTAGGGEVRSARAAQMRAKGAVRACSVAR